MGTCCDQKQGVDMGIRKFLCVRSLFASTTERHRHQRVHRIPLQVATSALPPNPLLSPRLITVRRCLSASSLRLGPPVAMQGVTVWGPSGGVGAAKPPFRWLLRV